MKKTTALASLAAAGLILMAPLSAAAAPAPSYEAPPDIPGLCFVYVGGGWLGAPCPEPAEPVTPDPVAPADPVGPVTPVEPVAP